MSWEGEGTFPQRKATFVLDVVWDVAFDEGGGMILEIDEAVYSGGILGGCLLVFRGFAGGLEHSFHHGKDGMAIVGLAHGDRTTVSGSHACRAPKPADVRRVLPFVRCARWPEGA